MDIKEITRDIQAVLGVPLNSVNVKDSGNGIYSCNNGEDSYVIGMIGASDSRGRTYTQMQSNIKPTIMDAYENSKNNQEKFFLLAPNSSSFTCDDFYIFIELLEKGSSSSSFEINIPTGAPIDRVTRKAKKSGG